MFLIHIIGIHLNLKLFQPPIEARNVTRGKKTVNFYNCIIKSFWKNNKFKIRGVGRPKKVKTALFFEPSYVSELLHDSSDESDDVNEAVAVAAVDDDDDDDNENKGDDASDLEAEPTVSKASTVPKVSKKRGPRCPYKKNLNNSFLTHLNYYIIVSYNILLNIIIDVQKVWNSEYPSYLIKIPRIYLLFFLFKKKTN